MGNRRLAEQDAAKTAAAEEIVDNIKKRVKKKKTPPDWKVKKKHGLDSRRGLDLNRAFDAQKRRIEHKSKQRRGLR